MNFFRRRYIKVFMWWSNIEKVTISGFVGYWKKRHFFKRLGIVGTILNNIWNFMNFWVKRVSVTIRSQGWSYKTNTDSKGNFFVSIPTDQLFKIVKNKYWYDFSVIHQYWWRTVSSSSEVFIWTQDNPPYAIISDLDDTILISHATNFWQKIWEYIINSFQSRKSFYWFIYLYNWLSSH